MNKTNILSLVAQTSAELAPWGERIAQRLGAGQWSGLRYYETQHEAILSYATTPLPSVAAAMLGTRRARKLKSVARRLGALIE